MLWPCPEKLSTVRMFPRVMPMARRTANSWLLRRALLKSTDPSAAIAMSPRNAASTCGRVCTLRRLVNSLGKGRRGDVLGERSQCGFEVRSRSLPIRTWRKADREHPLVTQRTTWRNRRYDPVELRGGQPETFVKLRMHVAWEQGFADDTDPRSGVADGDRVSYADVQILRRGRADGRLTSSSRTAPEVRVKVIGVVVVPAIGRTEKTGAPT